MLKNIGALLGLGMSMLVFLGAAQAAEGVDLIALATARGKAEAALQGFEPYSDDHKSGVTQLWFKIDKLRNDSNALYNAELQKECRIPAETKQIQKKMQENDQNYTLLKNQTGATIDHELNAVRTRHNALKSAFDQLPGPEQQFKTAKMDFTPLKSLYETIEKRALELQAQAKEIIASLDKIEKEWEANVAATKAFLSQKTEAQK